MTDEAVVSGLRQLGAWLREAAWPLWLRHGIDRTRGGFFEALDLRDYRCRADYRRLRVVGRQIMVFSEAHRAGLDGAAQAARIGLDFIDRHAVHEAGGYAWRFDLDHRPVDLTRDLYDHAFVLLALASATAVMPRETLHAQALDLLAWIKHAFPHPEGGYQESLPPALPRRQNPHMHLLEAALAAYEAFGDTSFLDLARGLADVFTRRLFDAQSGALPEFFDEALTPHRENGVFLIEPGHHCEWAWLIHCYQNLAGADSGLQHLSSRLMHFVDAHGIEPQFGGLVGGVFSNGAIAERSARLWPQTERLKAEFLRPDASAQKQRQAIGALAAHLRDDGLWHERRLADGTLSAEPAPASSLYHLTCGILAAEAASKSVLF